MASLREKLELLTGQRDNLSHQLTTHLTEHNKVLEFIYWLMGELITHLKFQ